MARTKKGTHAGRRAARSRSSADMTDARRDAIVDAVVQLVRDVGVSKLTFDEVAGRLELTRSAPFYYFGNRVGLLAAIAQRGFERLTSRLRETRDAAHVSDAAVKDLAVAYA